MLEIGSLLSEIGLSLSGVGLSMMKNILINVGNNANQLLLIQKLVDFENKNTSMSVKLFELRHVPKLVDHWVLAMTGY